MNEAECITSLATLHINDLFFDHADSVGLNTTKSNSIVIVYEKLFYIKNKKTLKDFRKIPIIICKHAPQGQKMKIKYPAISFFLWSPDHRPLRGEVVGLFFINKEIPMKICTKCKQTLSETCFYKNKNFKDGLQYKCKECDKKETATWKKTNPKRLQEYQDTHRSEKKEYDQRYYVENKEAIARSGKQYNRIHKKEILARRKVYLAKTNGSLIPQPCETCSSTENIHGHHDDYDKPLDVRWLCSSHHRRLHAKQRRLAQ